MEDSQPFSIGFCLLEDGPIHALPNGVLFPKGHSIPSEKVLTMCKSSEFQMEAFYVDEHELPPGVSPKISIFKVYYGLLIFFSFNIMDYINIIYFDHVLFIKVNLHMMFIIKGQLKTNFLLS